MPTSSDAPGSTPAAAGAPGPSGRLRSLRTLGEALCTAGSLDEAIGALAATLEAVVRHSEARVALEGPAGPDLWTWRPGETPVPLEAASPATGIVLEVPIASEGHEIGALVALRSTGPAFSADDAEALAIAAQMLGSVLGRVRREIRQPHELAGILEIARSLTSEEELPDLFGTIPERVARLVGAARCVVATFDSAANRIVARPPGYNMDPAMISEARFPSEWAKAVDLPGNSEYPIFENDVVGNPRFEFPLVRRWGIASVLCAPIRAKGATLGYLYALDKPGGFDEGDARLAAIVAAHAAEALANERLLEAVRAQARREALLNRITAAVRESLELDEILDTTVRMLSRSLDLCRAYVAFVDRDRGIVRVSHEALAPGMKSTAGEFPIKLYGEALLRSLERGDVFVVDDAETDARVEPFRKAILEPLGTRSLVYVPVFRESTLLAVIGFSLVRSTRRWTNEEIALAQAVADQLAVAMRQATLFSQQRRAAEHRALINRINTAVRASLDLDTVLETTVQELGRALEVDRCYVLAPGPFPPTVETVIVRHEYCRPGAASVKGVKMPVRNRAREGPVLNVEEPLVINDITLNPRLVSRRKADLLALTDTSALLSVRAIYGEQVLGLIELNGCFEPRTWTHEEIELVVEVAAQLAVAIHNAQLFRRVTASERQWHTTFNSMTDGLALLDPAGQVVRVNDSMLRFCSLSDHKDAVGRYYYELVHGEENDTMIRRVLTTSQRVQVERDIPARGLALRESIDPIFDESGTVAGLVVVVHDVTREREAERAIRYRNRQLAALNAIGAATTHTTELGEIVDGAFSRIIDVTAADIGAILLVDESGEHLEPLATHGGAARAAALVGRNPKAPVAAAVFESDTPLTLAELAQRFGVTAVDPGPDPVRAAIFAPIRSHQRPLGIITVGYSAGHGFTANERQLLAVAGQQLGVAVENARLIANLQSALERVREANRVKDEFLAVVSHELRTPLTSIQGWSEVLQDPEVDSEQLAEGLAAIHHASASLTQLISDLLDLSRIEHNVLRLDLQRVDPNYPVRAAITTVRQLAEAKGVELSAELAEGLPQVDADPGRIQQVVWNLLVNSIKFTPAGGHVWVETDAPAPAIVRIRVRDDGTGITDDFLPHVFERFRQADSSATRHFGGLGLGLSLVRSLVEAHHGDVIAESEGRGLGATFTVTLPVAG